MFLIGLFFQIFPVRCRPFLLQRDSCIMGQPTLNSMIRALIIKLDLTHNGLYNTVKFCG